MVADIPGLIEGAHTGAGLGINFLKHIERTTILLYMIDISPMEDKDPVAQFDVLRNELNKFSPDLLEKPALIALNKIDTLEQDDQKEIAEQFKKKGFSVLLTSAYVGTGLKELVFKLGDIYEKIKSEEEL